MDLFNTLTAVTTNTPPRRVLISLLKPEFSWTSINCFHGFLTRSDREGSFESSLNEGRRLTRIISNDDSVFNYFIKIKITLLKQRGLCYLSEIAEIFSIAYIKVFMLFIYLFDCMKTREPWTTNYSRSINLKKRKISHRQGTKFHFFY